MSAGNPNTLIVMGASPDSYYVGYGRRHFVQGMSPSFTNHADTALNITMTLWISMSRSLDSWVDYNVASDQFHFNADIAPDIRNHLSGTNGKCAAGFITFPDSTEIDHFFVGGKARGAWSCKLADHFTQGLTRLQRETPNFDTEITGVLFGKGKTHILLARTGFVPDFDEDEITSTEHPLYKILAEFIDGWCIDRGSQLCFYDSRFYFLKFTKPGDGGIKMRWNLPVTMTARLEELKVMAQDPAEHAAQVQEDEAWLAVAQRRMNGQLQANNFLVNTMNHAGLSFHAAASGGTIVERKRYY
ncbi:hypothetical protein DFH08DRAFT_840677 [Mycena albidolilacea]|uniref:Uncharacterized protein n=1 Tax=Mycena albidolilacea TaxID=1033008 RepID=A0AAD7F1U4_9AGAR|nr:hypothetical protein DFH08DRAFT_840677 [Mycena albidolilacea]